MEAQANAQQTDQGGLIYSRLAVSAAPSMAPAPPPPFLSLAAHPLRWRLLAELAQGDRRVRDLCGSAGEQQSLVSYHLGVLRKEGLVSTRRSTADGRETYYLLDFERCRELLVAAGRALHPGLIRAQDGGGEPTRAVNHIEVLFLCTGNSARSQIAQELIKRRSRGSVRAVSAGSDPKPLHPNALRVMRERGLPVARLRPKHLSAFAERQFDFVITLCDRVREICPEFLGGPQQIHWSIPDPGQQPGSEQETLPAFERVADELSSRIGFFLDAIALPQPTSEVTPDDGR